MLTTLDEVADAPRVQSQQCEKRKNRWKKEQIRAKSQTDLMKIESAYCGERKAKWLAHNKAFH